MKKKVLAATLAVLSVGAILTASALAAPRLWTDSTAKTLLRSVKTAPINQPDALEFANEGSVAFILMSGGAQKTILCNEVEFGNTVVLNNELNKATNLLETKLAMPFGVAEGDNCTSQTSAGTVETVPTYFDTNPAGDVPATITLTGGPPFFATIRKLKFSQNIEGKFCTATVEGVMGEVTNGAEPFVEESPPNLTVAIKAPIPVVCGKTKVPAELIARFFLETMSTTTDTAFISR
jgi:hypothetical protein